MVVNARCACGQIPRADPNGRRINQSTAKPHTWCALYQFWTRMGTSRKGNCKLATFWVAGIRKCLSLRGEAAMQLPMARANGPKRMRPGWQGPAGGGSVKANWMLLISPHDQHQLASLRSRFDQSYQYLWAASRSNLDDKPEFFKCQNLELQPRCLRTSAASAEVPKSGDRSRERAIKVLLAPPPPGHDSCQRGTPKTAMWSVSQLHQPNHTLATSRGGGQRSWHRIGILHCLSVLTSATVAI